MNYKNYPLTNSQQRIWFTQTIYPDSSMFNIGGTAIIKGKIDVNILKQAFFMFVHEHDAFRMRIAIENDRPIQYFYPVDEENSLDTLFVNFENYENKEEQLHQWIQNQVVQQLFVENMPLYRFAVFSLDPEQYGYLILIHHIMADGWSFQMFTRELQENYALLSKNKQISERIIYNFEDYLVCEEKYLKSQRYEKDRLYWNEIFSSPIAEATRTCSDLKGYRHTFFISKERSKSIKCFCDFLNMTENAFYVGLYILYTYKVQGLTDIVVGNPVLGRAGRKEREIFGMFVNTIPVRYQVNEDESIADFFKNVDKRIKNNFLHQKYPYNHIVRDQALGDQSLYTACVNYYHTKMVEHFSGMPVHYTEFYNGQQEYDLQLIIRDWEDDCRTQIDIDCKELYLSREQLLDMFVRLEIIIDFCVANHRQSLGNISLLTDTERLQQLIQFNDTYVELPEGTILDLLFRQLRLTPERCAVKDGKYCLSYVDLFERAYALALQLQRGGIRRGSIVGLLAQGSAEAMIAIMGILTAGAAYLPLDPRWPHDRIDFVLKDAGVKVLLSDRKRTDELHFTGEVISLEDLPLPDRMKIEKLSYPKKDDLAYVIYTSGSSGQPKGVLIGHNSLMNYILWAKNKYIRKKYEIMPLYSSLAFDLTVTTIFLPLICGGTIIVYRNSSQKNVLDCILDENLCTIIKLTPAHLRILSERNDIKSKIHTLIVGGEKFSSVLAKKIKEKFLSNITIYNEYGPTEATVGCMIYKYDCYDQTDSVPIGKPIDNIYILVVDRDRNPVPLRVQGELYVGGTGLFRGYLNRSDLMEECLISNLCGIEGPFYKSGDIVRFIRPDCLEYIRRADQQIKINGYRIEPTEIENHLFRYPYIQDVVVVHLERDETDILCAYYVADKRLDANKLRIFLASQLPNYMIPTIFYYIDNIPLTVNKKIDYSKLPCPWEMESEEIADVVNNKFLNDKEKILLACLSSVLEREISMEQNFYYVGGDSIKAIQVSSHLHEKGYCLAVKDILANPIIRNMADCIHCNLVPLYEQEVCSGSVPLTPIIEWFFHVFGKKKEYQKVGNRYCHCLSLVLSSGWTRSEMQEILGALIEHHDSLRLNYDAEKHCLRYNEQRLEQLDLVSEYNLEGRTVEYERILNKQKNFLINSMDILKGILIRAVLVHADELPDTLLLVVHHLAIDGVSWRIMLEDLQTLLSQTRTGQFRELLPKTASFQSWAKLITRSSYRYVKEYDFWKQQQAENDYLLGMLDLFENYEIIQDVLDEQVTQKLITEACEFYRTNTQELLIGTLSVAVGEAFYMDEVIIEIENHGRDLVDDEIDITRTVGWFASSYPIKLPVNRNNRDGCIKKIKEILRNVPNSGIGYGLCSNILDKWDRESQWIRFNFIGSFQTEFEQFTVCSYDNIEVILPQTNFLDILVSLQHGRINLSVRYWPSRLRKEEVKLMVDRWREAITEMIYCCLEKKVPELTPSDFPNILITQEELDRLFE